MSYRNLTNYERQLINRIINYQPLQRPTGLTLHISNRVREIFTDGSIEFELPEMDSPYKQSYYPVEAQFFDSDVPVNALVFFIGNEVSMLEIVKADGSRISRKPAPEEWEIIDLSY